MKCITKYFNLATKMYTSVFICINNTSWKTHTLIHMRCSNPLTIDNICKFIRRCN